MADPDATFNLSPHELVLYMSEMLTRLDRVGDRLVAYAESQDRRIVREVIVDDLFDRN